MEQPRDRPPGVMSAQDMWDRIIEDDDALDDLVDAIDNLREKLLALERQVNSLESKRGARQAFIDWCEAYGIDTECMKP